MLTDFIEAKGLKNVTLFVQYIGSIAGMLYTIREPQNVKGMALFEAPFMPAEVMYDQLPFSFRAFMRITRTKKWNEGHRSAHAVFLCQKRLGKQEGSSGICQGEFQKCDAYIPWKRKTLSNRKSPETDE